MMLCDFFDARRDDIIKYVWNSRDDSILTRADHIVKEAVDAHCMEPLKAFADRRRVTLSHDDSGITVKFAVPFSGSLDVMKLILAAHRRELRCSISVYGDLTEGYLPDGPVDKYYLVLEVASGYPGDVEHINDLFDKWHRIVTARMDEVNAYIGAFNDSLPGTVRKAVADRAEKIRHAEDLRTTLIGRYGNRRNS